MNKFSVNGGIKLILKPRGILNLSLLNQSILKTFKIPINEEFFFFYFVFANLFLLFIFDILFHYSCIANMCSLFTALQTEWLSTSLYQRTFISINNQGVGCCYKPIYTKFYFVLFVEIWICYVFLGDEWCMIFATSFSSFVDFYNLINIFRKEDLNYNFKILLFPFPCGLHLQA